jgi:hypothetical protein
VATKYTRFSDIPRFTEGGSWECDFRLDSVVRFVEEHQTGFGLDIDPDFQRGHVWNEAQQTAWLEFYLRGGKTGRVLYFNCPTWHMAPPKTGYRDFVIVDGKQRLQAITRFVRDEIKVFGSYRSEYEDDIRVHNSIRINVNDLKTRAAVLRWYIEFNSGGVIHSDEEINRVRALLAEEEARQAA